MKKLEKDISTVETTIVIMSVRVKYHYKQMIIITDFFFFISHAEYHLIDICIFISLHEYKVQKWTAITISLFTEFY